MKSIALLALIVSLMLFASCAMMPQWAVDRLPQLRSDSHVKVSESISRPASDMREKRTLSPDSDIQQRHRDVLQKHRVYVRMRESIPRPASDMGKKRTLGEYIRQVSNLLEEGNEETARLELKRSLYYYPDHDVLTTLYKQIDADPKAILGDKFTYYTIQPDDTLSTIAQGTLGDGLLFYLLAKYNDIKAPHMINVGQHIKIPESLEPSKPVERTPEIAATPPVPTPNPTHGLQAQEAPVEPGQAPQEPVRVAETAPGPMPIPQPEPNRPDTSPAPPKELSAIKDSTTTRRVMPQIAFGQYHALSSGTTTTCMRPNFRQRFLMRKPSRHCYKRTMASTLSCY